MPRLTVGRDGGRSPGSAFSSAATTASSHKHATVPGRRWLLAAVALFPTAAGTTTTDDGGPGGPLDPDRLRHGWDEGFEQDAVEVSPTALATPDPRPTIPVPWRTTRESASTGSQSLILQGTDGPPGRQELVGPGVPVQPGDIAVVSLHYRTREPTTGGYLLFWIELWDGAEWRRQPARRCLPSLAWRDSLGRPQIIEPGVLQVRAGFSASTAMSPDQAWFVDDLHVDVETLRDLPASTPARGDSRGTAADRPNIVLIGVDTLRADHLGCYNPRMPLTPAIDQMAAEGVRMANARAQAPWTKPSFGTIFTGVYPSVHRADDVDRVLSSDLTTLAEVLRDHGYFTAGFVASGTQGYLGSKMGFAQGFQSYNHYVTDGRLNEDVVRWLGLNARHFRDRGSKHPLFLFWHIIDPHLPYRRHDPRLVNKGALGTVDITYAEHVAPMTEGTLAWTEEDRAYVRELYQGEVQQTDRWVGRLMALLRASRLGRNTIIVFVADHGQALGEHGEFGHKTGWKQVLDVPYIVWGPTRVPSGVVVKRLVETRSVGPTILSLAGIPVPVTWTAESVTHSFDGHEDSDPKARTFSEDVRHGVLAFETPRLKLVLSGGNVFETGSGYVWDVRALQAGQDVHANLVARSDDPEESHNLEAARPRDAGRLRNATLDILEFLLTQSSALERNELDEETILRLKSLGYALE
jgi:arylsulfatase A-like enzyme